MKLEQFLKSGAYLPKPLRDFHAQKDVFKGIGENFIPNANYPMPNWVNAHVYVIDFFLWFMAQNGYTLQKSRAKVEFKNLNDTISIWNKARAKHFASLWEQTK